MLIFCCSLINRSREATACFRGLGVVNCAKVFCRRKDLRSRTQNWKDITNTERLNIFYSFYDLLFLRGWVTREYKEQLKGLNVKFNRRNFPIATSFTATPKYPKMRISVNPNSFCPSNWLSLHKLVIYWISVNTFWSVVFVINSNLTRFMLYITLSLSLSFLLFRSY